MKTSLAILLVTAACSSLHAQKPGCLVYAANAPATGSALWTRQGASQASMLTYLWGEYPSGMEFKSYIKDKEVDKIRAKGVRVLILDPKYTRDDLEKAKESCAQK